MCRRAARADNRIQHSWAENDNVFVLSRRCDLDPISRGTSPIRKHIPLGPFSRPMPMVLRGSWGGGRVLMGELPLYKCQSSEVDNEVGAWIQLEARHWHHHIYLTEVFVKSFGKSQFLHKSVSLSFIITNIRNKYFSSHAMY